MGCFPVSKTQQFESIETPQGWSLFIDDTDSLQLKQHRGVFEPSETQLCQQLIGPGARVVDVGANIGYYTKLFAHLVGSNGIVHAFEPSPDNLKILFQNVQDEVKQGSVQVHPIALGESSGSAILHLHEENTGKHRLYPSVVCQHEVAHIQVERGDALNLGPIDFLKIDVEGFEFQALSGLHDTLIHSPKLAILIEFAPVSILEAGVKPDALIQLLSDELGLHCLRPINDGWVLIPPNELIESMAPLHNIDAAELAKSVEGFSDLEIEQRVAEILSDLGFRFPLLENQLWVTRDSLREVLKNLSKPHSDVELNWLNAIARQNSNVSDSQPLNTAIEVSKGHLKVLGYHQIPNDEITTSENDNYRQERPPLWTQYWLHPEQSSLWNALFLECFGSNVSDSHLGWKYGHSRGFGLGAYSEHSLIGFIGGIPREVLCKGQLIDALQVCDVMVHPDFRHLQPRHGVFQQLAERFLRTQVGFNAPYRLGFGFPSQRAFKLAQRLNLYAPVDSMLEMTWACSITLKGYLSRSRPIRNSDAEIIDHLSGAMHRSFNSSILGKRSWAYIKSRYLEHPQYRYVCRLIVSKITSQPLGVLIFKPQDNIVLELVDLVASRQYLATMVHAALRFARRAQFTHMSMWITNSHHHLFNICSPKINPLDVVIPAYDSPQAPPPGDIIDTWFLMAGDSDFH